MKWNKDRPLGIEVFFVNEMKQRQASMDLDTELFAPWDRFAVVN